MSDSVSYWICSCGEANLNQLKLCRDCGRKRPRSRRLYALALGGGLLAAVAATGSGEPPRTAESLRPEAQRAFLAAVESAASEIRAAPNALAAGEALRARDLRLGAEAQAVSAWRGRVLGVQSMQGGGAVGIDVGGLELVAGRSLLTGRDTLISPDQGALYESLLKLEAGDEVALSGAFVVSRGALVELSATGSGSTASPRFLFAFSSIAAVSP